MSLSVCSTYPKCGKILKTSNVGWVTIKRTLAILSLAASTLLVNLKFNLTIFPDYTGQENVKQAAIRRRDDSDTLNSEGYPSLPLCEPTCLSRKR